MSRIDPKALKISRKASPDGFSFWDFLRNRAEGPEVALAYAHVFWPELLEVDSFILIRENYDPEYLARITAEFGRENVEATINTTYLEDLFPVGVAEVDESVWTVLGESVRDAWKARAEAEFPGGEFTATFSWYSEGGDPGVTLFQTKQTKSLQRR